MSTLLLLGQTSKLPSPVVSPDLLVASLGHEEVSICSWVGAGTPRKAKNQEVHRTVMDENWKYPNLKVGG